MIFSKPDLTGWKYKAKVGDKVSTIVVEDPDGSFWFSEKSCGKPTGKPYRTYYKPGAYHSGYTSWVIKSITEAGIEKGAKKIIRKCKRVYDKEARRAAIRAENHTKEF